MRHEMSDKQMHRTMVNLAERILAAQPGNVEAAHMAMKCSPLYNPATWKIECGLIPQNEEQPTAEPHK